MADVKVKPGSALAKLRAARAAKKKAKKPTTSTKSSPTANQNGITTKPKSGINQIKRNYSNRAQVLRDKMKEQGL